MTNVGWSTLDVIPSVKGLAGELDRQTRAPMAAAGRRSGRLFGDAAGREAGARFTGSLRTSLRGIAAPLAGVAAGLGGVRIFGDMIDEAEEAAKVTRITEQLVRTTGGAANQTANQIGNLAGKLSDYAAVDDEVVQAGENVLLTFRNVRNEIGQGNDIFSRASKAALDLSTVLGSDLNGSMLQLGKALQDPLKGITALGRAGVQFSAAQKAQIKTFVENNDLLSAQKVILAEIEKEVGGTAGANATAIDRLQVSFKNLEEAAGTALAPALNKFATITTDDVIPAAQAAGGVIGDATRTFGDLPTPIKAATAALVAFKVAQATGATSAATSGLKSLSSGLDSVRIRAMLAGDAYQTLRAGQLELINGSGRFTAGVGRMSASLGALRVGATGAGVGLKRGLSGASALVGGPWGAAFIAGTAIVAHFWAEHQKAKQRVEDFTATLDKETGALTENSREFAAKQLLDAGVLDSAKRLGVSLELVTDAALNQKGAMAALSAQIASRGQLSDGAAADAIKLKGAIDDSNGVVQTSIANQKLFTAALGASGAEAGRTATATDGATRSTGAYASEIDKARTAVQNLLDKENERRNKNLGAFQDQTRLAQALADARKEAGEGKRTLDANAEAGRKNRDSLASLADAWNSSANSVKNAKGAYADMRENFIKVAGEMGATEGQAKRLADRLLGIPKKTPAEVTTPGMDAALAKVRELNRLLRLSQGLSRIVITAQAAKNQSQLTDIHKAGGGLLRGPGSGTSDSILMWGSNGEFMQRKAAVDYYGVDFMRRLNAMQVPRFAGGGLVGGAAVMSAPIGQHLTGTLGIDRDGIAYIRGVVRSEIEAAERVALVSRRGAGIGGVPQ